MSLGISICGCKISNMSIGIQINIYVKDATKLNGCNCSHQFTLTTPLIEYCTNRKIVNLHSHPICATLQRRIQKNDSKSFKTYPTNNQKRIHIISQESENFLTPFQSQMMIAETKACKDLKSKKQCKKLAKNNGCKKEKTKKKCKNTCGECNDGNYW